ncbi:MAG: NUDIX hydrolase [Halobacteria archaeon]
MTDDGEWSLLKTEVEYETGWYTAGYDRYRQPDGSTKKYYWCELQPAAIVVAKTGNSLVFVEQFRPVVDEKHLELPAGIVEEGEEFTEAAKRELREETGYVAGELTLLDDYWVATGVLRHRRGIVAASDLKEGERDLQGNEFIQTRTVPITDAVEIAREAPTNDASIEGVFLAIDDGFI